jgi:hypothetical protein
MEFKINFTIFFDLILQFLGIIFKRQYLVSDLLKPLLILFEYTSGNISSLSPCLFLCDANDGSQTLGHILGGRGPRRYADPHGHMPLPLGFAAPAGAVLLDMPDDASGLFIAAELDQYLV